MADDVAHASPSAAGIDNPHRSSEESLMSAEDAHESPSSATSTSRLLRGPRRLSGVPVGQGTPVFSRANHTQFGDKMYDTRVYIRRMPSPMIGLPSTSAAGNRRRTHSSDNVYPGNHEAHHNVEYHSSDVFLPAGATHSSDLSSARGNGSVSSIPIRHTRTPSLGAISYVSRGSSVSDIVTSLPLRQSALAEEAISAPRICSRSSTRRSIGQEWTRHHWHKMKDLEQESERARRCSKLSSGFAPLMVFGGLVFVCIGISANTNTGKDRERLKELSAAPLAMGIFMLILGAFLVATWFGCRSRAKQLERKVLHGSRRNSQTDENLIQAVVAKLYNQIERAGLRQGDTTPTMPGVTIDGIVVHKSTTDASTEDDDSRNEVESRLRLERMMSRETAV